uniref:Uncharacterized protein n=1 Tax=Oryza meridionalis TaxID=40149 RepID=A0A0E0CNK3_9ORYZ
MSICARAEPPRGGGMLGKRKERERPSSEEQRAPPPPPPPLPAHPARFVKPMPPPFPKGGGGSSFKLMAGYLAHEFLRSGTLLGERPESNRAPAPAPAAASAGPAAPDPRTRYAEASLLLMAGGARVPGVVNPTQLGHWLRIKE